MQCQKCRSPLKLDSSLEDLNPAAFDLLVGTSENLHIKHIPPSRVPYPQERKQLYDKAAKKAASSISKEIIPLSGRSSETSKNESGNLAMSFVMLSESQVGEGTPSIKLQEEINPQTKKPKDFDKFESVFKESKAMSQEMEKISRLFEILTSRSDIDFPVCVECTDYLVKELQKRLDVATKERDAYVMFLKQVNTDLPPDYEFQESQKALAKARKDEQIAIEELEKLEQEKDQVDKEIAMLEEEARALDIEEGIFWHERNDFFMKFAEFQDVSESINLQYNHDSQVLDKLQRTNVYNDTFCISHDGNFGTINGLRLGRLSSIPVDWSEINAAWGHTVLLLQTVADRLGFKFQGYQLKPMGSTSRIISYESLSTLSSRNNTQHPFSSRQPKKAILELYSSGDMPLGLTFMHRHFDNAMVAFLDCMRQLGDFVESETAKETVNRAPLALPYKIEGDKIGDVSIKLGIAQDDAWSRACKFTLTCCKFLLAHTSNVNTIANNRRTT